MVAAELTESEEKKLIEALRQVDFGRLHGVLEIPFVVFIESGQAVRVLIRGEEKTIRLAP